MRDFDSIKQKEMGSIENRVRHIYNIGYEDGLKDGKESCQIDETEAYLMGTENAAKQFQPELKRAYNDGLNDAWGCARKIVCEFCDGGLRGYDLSEIFDTCISTTIMKDNTAYEAIEKIKVWEEKKKKDDDEIKVGDEVYIVDKSYLEVVTADMGERVVIMSSNGKYSVASKNILHKTGRYFTEIAEIMRKMREGEG